MMTMCIGENICGMRVADDLLSATFRAKEAMLGMLPILGELL